MSAAPACSRLVVFSLLLALLGCSTRQEASAPPKPAEPEKLLNVSFGFTKAFFADYNALFARNYKARTGRDVVIEQSHGPSGTQTEAVIQGKLVPDVLTLASPSDLDAIARSTKLLTSDWREAFDCQSSPYASAVVFAVRPGNPKGIHDFRDLAAPDRTLVTSNPQGCGGGRWNYAAAYGYGLSANDGDKNKANAFVGAFLKNVPVAYANQGEAGEAFLKQGKGDVLLTYESFVLSEQKKGNDKLELVVPPRTLEIELPVAVSEATKQRGTAELARAYLKGLYEPEAQELFAKHAFRPRLTEVAQRTKGQFPAIELVKSEAVLGSWAALEQEHFGTGGLFATLRGAQANAKP